MEIVDQIQFFQQSLQQEAVMVEEPALVPLEEMEVLVEEVLIVVDQVDQEIHLLYHLLKVKMVEVLVLQVHYMELLGAAVQVQLE